MLAAKKSVEILFPGLKLCPANLGHLSPEIVLNHFGLDKSEVDFFVATLSQGENEMAQVRYLPNVFGAQDKKRAAAAVYWFSFFFIIYFFSKEVKYNINKIQFIVVDSIVFEKDFLYFGKMVFNYGIQKGCKAFLEKL